VKQKMVGDVGYVRVTTFNEQTVKALDRALETTRKGALKGLVLDLRDNPGGLLEASIEVSSRFLNGGEVVSTRGRHDTDSKRYNAVRANRYPERADRGAGQWRLGLRGRNRRWRPAGP
jgi:carboxyl-terminal processing protease